MIDRSMMAPSSMTTCRPPGRSSTVRRCAARGSPGSAVGLEQRSQLAVSIHQPRSSSLSTRGPGRSATGWVGSRARPVTRLDGPDGLVDGGIEEVDADSASRRGSAASRQPQPPDRSRRARPRQSGAGPDGVKRIWAPGARSPPRPAPAQPTRRRWSSKRSTNLLQACAAGCHRGT